MLWYKTWLETRWRFLIGLGLLICSAAVVVLVYPRLMEMLPLLPSVDLKGDIGRQIKESAGLTREYRGYIWAQWFGKNLLQLWTVFAVLLGAGGLLSEASGRATLFTLSLPVSRNRLLGVRGTAGIAELLVLAVVPSLLVPLLSPIIGQTYSVRDALIHGICLFIAGGAFFSLALLLSTVFSGTWRPLLIGLSVAVVLPALERASGAVGRYGLFHAMRAEPYFRTGDLPWPGLLVSAALSAVMLYGAAINFARRDF